jgi:hypothetical protein
MPPLVTARDRPRPVYSSVPEVLAIRSWVQPCCILTPRAPQAEPVGRQTCSPARERWETVRHPTALSPAKGPLAGLEREGSNAFDPGLARLG